MSDVDLSGIADFSVIGAFGTPAGGITLSSTVTKLSVPTSWATSSHGATPDVLYESSSILTMPAGVTAFDFYAEPEPGSLFSMTATADDGTFVTQTVDGAGGAKYFGFHGTGGTTISLISISSLSPSGFAYGEMRTSTSSPIPEPGTLGLLGLALAGVFVVRRKRASRT